MITLSHGKYKPGIHRGMSFEEYAAIPAINKSSLAYMAESPAACLLSLQGKLHKDSSGFALGSALDDLLTGNLSDAEFTQRHPMAGTCEAPLKSGKRKGQPCGCSAKNRYEGGWMCDKHAPEADPIATAKLTADDYRALVGMAEAVRTSDTRLLLDGCKAHQVVVLWNDEETGLPMKARLDGWGACKLPDSEFVESVHFDWKTTSATSIREWESDANKYKYALQDCHYLAGCEALDKLDGREPSARRFVFGVVESQPTSTGKHRAFLWQYDEASRIKAYDERRYLINKVYECVKSGEWPEEKISGVVVGSCPDYMFSHLKNG